MSARDAAFAPDAETVVRRRVNVLGAFDIMRATYRRHRFTPHAHEEFAMGVIERGTNRLQYRGSSHLVSAGQIVVVHPGEIHTGEATSDEGWSYRMFYPRPELLQMAAVEVSGAREVPFFPSPVIDDPPLARALAAVHRTLEEGGDECALEREARFLEALGALVSRHAAPVCACPIAPRSEPRGVRVAREFIEANFTSVVRLPILAGLAGLSQFHFIRVFRASVGVSPYLYLLQLRVSHAMGLLRAGHSPSQVAYMAGFSDQSHFTRHFKRAIGIPPGEYVRGLRYTRRAPPQSH